MLTNFKAAYKYALKNCLKSAAIFTLVMLLVISTLAYFSAHTSDTTFTSSYGMTSCIFVFVMGIVCIRENTRLFAQFGVDRQSSFLASVLSFVTLAVVLGVVGELLVGGLQAVFAPRFYIADLYELIYLSDNPGVMSFNKHLLRLVYNSALIMMCGMTGIFFSLLFWRLNKLWTIIVAICIPVVTNGVPVLISLSGIKVEPLIDALTSHPVIPIICWLVIAVCLAVIDKLLLRRANIKAPGSH